MNINILTHPLTGNYGGMLQAYALQCIFLNQKSQPKIIDYKSIKTNKDLCNIKLFIKDILKLMAYGKLGVPLICRKRVVFNFRKSYVFNDFLEFYKFNKNDVWIVGSDQVWRCQYARSIRTPAFFFLDFLTEKTRNKSISYAASFGLDEWEGTPEETEECGRLLRQFKAVSVREQSGIDICLEKFGVKAVQMPDPTLLLKIVDYETIINDNRIWLPQKQYIAAYILDDNIKKFTILNTITEILGMPVQFLMPCSKSEKRRDRFPISVQQWLCLIRDAKYVVTDSFHGCVFSIIYNKPFVCLGNKERGSARFDSLLKTFGLRDRIFTHGSNDELIQLLSKPIDWVRVNSIHDAERERGITFLKENLPQ